MMTITETAAWLKERDNYLIITHRRPDGDTIGCAVALAQGLREIGKTAFLLANPETTERYLQYAEKYHAADSFIPDNVITTDTASYELFPSGADEYIGHITLSIDHHSSNQLYAVYTCLDGTCAACGEIIYEILMEISGKISEMSAECLYIALSTDTGCFAFANTTANTLRVAALTIEAGAPHREINRKMFRTRTRGRIKLEGMINSGLEFYYGGQVAIASISRAMREECGANEDDLDDIASVPGSVEGVLAGITIRELSSETDCKVSVRTSPTVSAHAICERFGGGGHPMAAGFQLNKTILEIKEGLLAVLAETFPHGQS